MEMDELFTEVHIVHICTVEKHFTSFLKMLLPDYLLHSTRHTEHIKHTDTRHLQPPCCLVCGMQESSETELLSA